MNEPQKVPLTLKVWEPGESPEHPDSRDVPVLLTADGEFITIEEPDDPDGRYVSIDLMPLLRAIGLSATSERH